MDPDVEKTMLEFYLGKMGEIASDPGTVEMLERALGHEADPPSAS